ncbi:SAM-dependent methyltransferase [Catenulispora sp. GP43]|uniref:class I SAM-dependent DNA methyltransferase n=1 Tax=Catenulispora sp. GP43 TaxID=3156263 RepID=UPI003514A37A
MPDAIFAHPRLAAIYDTFDDDRSDLDAYVAIAAELTPGPAAASVVDVGCGTGSLAVRLAALGYRVTGVDPAAASLAVARTKPHADAVTWIEGDATALPSAAADLALMTGNVAQVFLTDEDWIATLHAIAAALHPGAHFVFETRRPERRGWEEWTADAAPVVREVPGIGTVQERRAFLSVDVPYVSFGSSYHFPDGEIVNSQSTLRFREREEVQAGLDECGFDVVDVREAPDRMGKEFVFVARRRDHR